jgi:hypothetical protein
MAPAMLWCNDVTCTFLAKLGIGLVTNMSNRRYDTVRGWLEITIESKDQSWYCSSLYGIHNLVTLPLLCTPIESKPATATTLSQLIHQIAHIRMDVAVMPMPPLKRRLVLPHG